MSPKMIDDYWKANEQFGKNALFARTGIRCGWRSFRLTPLEAAQYEIEEIIATGGYSKKDRSVDWVRHLALTSRTTGISPDEIDSTHIESDILTVIPFKK